ncbi:MAG TPA: hypothetical protein VM491_14120, partial [Burkholderiaceae bacterium]|nr:hypothetical protein [Burkholderiaceae bacterium]
LLTFLLLALERAIQMGVGLLVVAAVARAFPLEEFATWQIAFSMWIVAAAATNLTGDGVAMPRLFAATATGQTQPMIRTLLAAKLVCGIAGAVLLVGWAALLGRSELVLLATVWSAHLLLVEPGSMAMTESYAADRFAWPQVARLLGLAVRCAVVTAAYLLQGPLWWYALGWGLEAAVFSLVLCRGWGAHRWRFRGPLIDGELRSILYRGAALAVAPAVMAAVSRTDRLVFSASIPVEELARYAGALTMVEALFGFAGILATVAGAKLLYRPEPIAAADHRRTLVQAALLGAVAGGLLWWLADPLVPMLLGERFSGSIVHLQHACGLLPLVFVQAMAQAPLLARSNNAFHVGKALTALAVGIGVVAIVVDRGAYAWLSAGAYAGFACMLAADLLVLWIRRHDIYVGASRSPL